MFLPPHVAYSNRIRPGRKKAERWNGQSALGPMCDAKKDWQERYFRTSGAINVLVTRSRCYPDSLYRTRVHVVPPYCLLDGKRPDTILLRHGIRKYLNSPSARSDSLRIFFLFSPLRDGIQKHPESPPNSPDASGQKPYRERKRCGFKNIPKRADGTWNTRSPYPPKNSMDIFATKGDLFNNQHWSGKTNFCKVDGNLLWYHFNFIKQNCDHHPALPPSPPPPHPPYLSLRKFKTQNYSWSKANAVFERVIKKTLSQ